MSLEPRDPELSDRFAELGRADAAKAPPFAAMYRARARRISAWWIVVPAVSFAAAAAAVVIGIGLSAERAAPPASAPVASAARPTPEPDLRVALEPDPLGFLLEQPALGSIRDFDTDPTRKP